MRHLLRRSVLVSWLFLTAPWVEAQAPTAGGLDGALRGLLERRGEAFVAAMNAPGDQPLVDFARAHLERRVVAEGITPRFVERMNVHRADLGRLEGAIFQVLRDGNLLFVVVRGAQSGAWFNFQFRVMAADEHRLQLVFVAQAIEPMVRPTTPIEAPETRAWLDRFAATLERQQPFSGVALVVAGERELWSHTGGVAVAEPRVAMTRAARHGMASGSKLFTAVATLQLVEQGKLELDSRLAEILPDFPNREWAERATIRQLLTHTAGAGNYWDEEYERAWHAITETSQMLPHVLRNLGATPAGSFSYSNSGYILLGLVIEKVTGKSYFDVVAERIFEPAGMRATGYPIRSSSEPGLARPYRPEYEAGLVKVGSYQSVELGGRGSAAGGAASTADDLVAFVRALASGKLLRPETLRQMIAPQVEQGLPGLRWGLGPSVETVGERSGPGDGAVFSWGHGGSAPGTQFELRVYPARGIVAVVMSNYDTIAGVELAKAIHEIVRGGGV